MGIFDEGAGDRELVSANLGGFNQAFSLMTNPDA